jgi:hypothetical protein
LFYVLVAPEPMTLPQAAPSLKVGRTVLTINVTWDTLLLVSSEQDGKDPKIKDLVAEESLVQSR